MGLNAASAGEGVYGSVLSDDLQVQNPPVLLKKLSRETVAFADHRSEMSKSMLIPENC